MNRGPVRCTWLRHPRCWLSAGLALIAGCMVDDDDVCGENQVEKNGYFRACECTKTTVPSEDGRSCRPCGVNEHAQSGMCVCNDGFIRPDAGAPCTASAASRTVETP